MNALHLHNQLAVLSACCLLLGCAKEPGEIPKEKAKSPKPELVGRVASIPQSREFVLIQSYGTWSVEAGAILTTTGPEGRAANLKVTGEKLGQFAAADVQSGTLEIGDGVFTSVSSPKSTSSGTEQEKLTEALPEPKPESTLEDIRDDTSTPPPPSSTDTSSFPN